MKQVAGNVKMFVLINTTNYNNDGKYCVSIGNLNEMKELGFTTEEEIRTLDRLEVDELATTDFVGCYVIRIA